MRQFSGIWRQIYVSLGPEKKKFALHLMEKNKIKEIVVDAFQAIDVKPPFFAQVDFDASDEKQHNFC